MNRRLAIGLGMAGAAALIGALVLAQDFRHQQGSSQRSGRPSLSASTVAGTPETSVNNPGRGFLRWWSPARLTELLLDNDATVTSAVGGSSAPLSGVWTTPGALGATDLAFNFDQEPGIASPYRLARTTAQSLGSADATAGSTASYQWRFTGLTPGQPYQLFVNMPIGPTAVSFPANASDFPQRHFVYEILGAEGGADVQTVDLFLFGGGRVPLGAGGAQTTRTYIPTGTELSIVLHNTTPRSGQGAFLDPQAAPGEEWVYADSASIETNFLGAGLGSSGTTVAELAVAPPAGASAMDPDFNTRVVSARNDGFVLGSIGRSVSYGLLSSFIYDGENVSVIAGNSRLNRAWSFPVAAPADLTDDERDRYNRDLRDWMEGPAVGSERHTRRVVVDDTQAFASFGASTLVSPATPQYGEVGPSWRDMPASPGVLNGFVTYSSNVPDGRYRVQVRLPIGDAPNEFATTARYQIISNGTVLQTITLDQTRGDGWVDLPNQPADGYAIGGTSGPFFVVVLNETGAVDAGRKVWVDAIRYVGENDLTQVSTPLQVPFEVPESGAFTTRETVIAAGEDGRIRALDAHGDRTAGTTTQFWVYPPETAAAAADLNDPSQDGGIAEAPTGFGSSSPATASIGGRDMVFAGAANGRVYALRSALNSAGVERVWSWPTDYRPDAPLTNRDRTFRQPIKGSVAIVPSTASASGFVVVVPTQEGRLVALDPAGDPASKSTTVLWQYPAASDTALGAITTTPIVNRSGDIILTAPAAQGSSLGVVVSIDPDTGLANWTRTGPSPDVFAAFTDGAATTAPDHVEFPNGANYVIDSAGLYAVYDDAGTLLFSSIDPTVIPSGPLQTTYLTTFNTVNTATPDTLVLMVPTKAGQLVGLHATNQGNSLGERKIWQYSLEGRGPASPISVGGKDSVELRSWMFATDSEGFTYGFNGNDDSDPGVITPGTPPGQRVDAPDDPGSGELETILDSTFVQFVSWQAFNTIRDNVTSGAWTAPQILPAINADRNIFRRRTFEMGETLYMVAYNLPNLAASTTGAYYLEFIIRSGTKETRVSARPIATSNPAELACFWAIPIGASGARAVDPGENIISVRAVPVARRNTGSTEVAPQSPIGSLPTATPGLFNVAHPLSIGFFQSNGARINSVGDTTDATNPANTVNGAAPLDAGSNAGLLKEALSLSGSPTVPGAYMGPQLFDFGSPVSHASAGYSRITVKDRSLSFLLYGTGRGRANAARGLPNVRLELEDMAWQVFRADGTLQADRNVVSPMPAAYAGFEQLPTTEPNSSADYPDISRGQFDAVRSFFGRPENPLTTAVALEPPVYSDASLTTYRTPTGFNSQLARTLTSTPFDVRVNVPRYQPASGPETLAPADRRGYIASGRVFLQSGGEDAIDSQANRPLSMGVRVGIDRRVETTTPTVDLGSLPIGSGFDGGAGGSAAAPINPASGFRPWNGVTGQPYSQQFAPFSVLNEGNVNLQNLRVAKGRDNVPGSGVVSIIDAIQTNDSNANGVIDPRLNLFTSLDPRWSETGPLRANLDAGFNRLVKPRPGDPVGTRFSTNPVRRTNAALGVAAGPLLPSPAFPIGDPVLGVSVPPGTPSGEYSIRLNVIEDVATPVTDVIPGLGSAVLPTLGPVPANAEILEPFADPGVTLRMRVREARATNGATAKGAPMVDRLIPPGPFFWDNTGPAILRQADGSVLLAFASNRAVNPAQELLARNGSQLSQNVGSRIHLSLMEAGGPIFTSPSMLNDAWTAASPEGGMFRKAAAFPPTGTPQNLFPIRPGETVVPGSISFTGPSLPESGSTSPLEAGPIRSLQQDIQIAYHGRAAIRAADGSVRTAEHIFASPVAAGLSGGAPTTLLTPDSGLRFSRPSLVQALNSATVFFSASSSSGSQLRSSSWTVGGAGGPVLRAYTFTGGLTEIGAPTAALRRRQNQALGVIDLTFPAKRAGRPSNELFHARLEADAAGFPTGAALRFPLGLQALEGIGRGVFLARAASWAMADADLAAFDIVIQQPGAPGGLQSIIRGGVKTRQQGTGFIAGQTTLGGEFTADPSTGRVELRGAVLPGNRALFVIVRPGLLAVSEGTGSDYAGADSVFDDRLLPVRTNDPHSPNTGAVNYWFSENGTGFLSTNPLALLSSDRLVISASATPAGASRTVRPVMKSMRFGVQLPFPIALNPANGEPLVTVQWNALGNPLIVPTAERRYQVDAAKGRIYLPSGAEDFNIIISYTPASQAGAPLPAIGALIYPVTLITEMSERLVPIEQAANEVDLSLSLEPATFQTATFRTASPLWMAWTSTRAGAADVFFQNLAPNYTILPPGG